MPRQVLGGTGNTPPNTQQDTFGPPCYPILSLSGETEFTMGSLEAFNMQYMEGMMRNRKIGLVDREALCEGGFDGWWSPVDKLIGCIDYPNGTRAFIAQNLPWDGAVGGELTRFFGIRTTVTK